MHWNKLPNIWSRYVELDNKAHWRIKLFKHVKFDFRRAAQQCRIKLHYQDSSSSHRMITCTVAEAVEKYLRPGRWIVPRAIPRTALGSLMKSAIEPVDYRNNEPYAAVLGYDLVRFDTNVDKGSDMFQKRGPQMFLLDYLPDFPHRDISVVSKAFKALSIGKVATFAISSRYKFIRGRERSITYDDEDQLATSTALIEDEFTGLGQNSERISGRQKRGTPNETSELKIGIQARNEDNYSRPQLSGKADSHIEQIAETSVKSLSSHEQSLREEQDWQRRLESNRRLIGKSSKDSKRQKLYGFNDDSGSGVNQSNAEEMLYPSRYLDRLLGTESSISVESDTEHHGAQHLQEMVEDTRNSNLIHVEEPFGKQISNSSLVLTRRRKEHNRPSNGAYMVIAWATKYMPHMWPEVMLACMPKGCKIDIEPRSDKGSIQYVIKPPIDTAVSSILKDSELRRSKDWISMDQTTLAKLD